MASEAPHAPTRDAEGGRAALLIIDMINAFDFENGPECHELALDIVSPILALREKAERLEIPVIYVNDNFSQWHSERSRLIDHAVSNGSEVSRHLAPRDDDYFVIKPQFSGFYATNLQVLLPKLGVRRLILTGIATDICVLFTGADAHMRDYALWVPIDCTATADSSLGVAALKIMQNSMDAEIAPSTHFDIATWSAAR